MALELVAAWCIPSSGLGCAAAAPDGVMSLVWWPASATLVGGAAPHLARLPLYLPQVAVGVPQSPVEPQLVLRAQDVLENL